MYGMIYKSDIFDITWENTGGGCMVYTLIGKESGLALAASDEIVGMAISKDGKMLTLYHEEYNNMEDHDTGTEEMIEVWNYNSNYPKEVWLQEGVMRFLGFTENEIVGLRDSIQNMLNEGV